MENLDLELLRILLKQLCKEPAGDEKGMSANAVFDFGAAPGYDKQRDVVRTHYELLVDKGFAQVGRIHMKHHPDFAVLEPTEHGRIWCRYAYDDREWEQHVEEFRSILIS
jgi:hypothetical protein